MLTVAWSDSYDATAAAGQEAHAAIASAMAGGNTKKSKYRGVNANWSRWRAQVSPPRLCPERAALQAWIVYG